MSALWKLVLLTFAQLYYCHGAATTSDDIEILDPDEGQLILAHTVSSKILKSFYKESNFHSVTHYFIDLSTW